MHREVWLLCITQARVLQVLIYLSVRHFNVVSMLPEHFNTRLFDYYFPIGCDPERALFSVLRVSITEFADDDRGV